MGSLANSTSPAEVGRAKSNQQNLICSWWLRGYMRGGEDDQDVVRVNTLTLGRAPIGPNLIHSPQGQDMVTQHRDRFCAPHCFDVSHGLRRNLDNETSSIGNLILLCFHPYKERPKQSWHVIWATILVRTVPGIRIGFQLNLDWDSNLAGPPLLLLCTSTSLFKLFLISFIVPNHHNIMR
jgi:hypothetical protein